jgi:hypothetical protein
MCYAKRRFKYKRLIKDIAYAPAWVGLVRNLRVGKHLREIAQGEA